jgi:hypothetical protein
VNRMIFLGCMTVLAGCGDGHSASSSSLSQPLSVRTSTIDDSRVTFTIQGGYSQPTAITMTSPQALLSLHTTAGRAELDALTLPLGDVTISPDAMPPNGLILRNMVLRADASRADVLHAQDDALELRAMVPLTLDWSMQLQDGSLYRLGPAHTAPLSVAVQIKREGARTIATLQAGCAGVCWAIDGVATLSDGVVYLDADAEVTGAK